MLEGLLTIWLTEDKLVVLGLLGITRLLYKERVLTLLFLLLLRAWPATPTTYGWGTQPGAQVRFARLPSIIGLVQEESMSFHDG